MNPIMQLYLPPDAYYAGRAVKFNPEDLALLDKVFPEHGAQSTLPALLTHQFCEGLRKANIKSFYDREQSNFSLRKLEAVAEATAAAFGDQQRSADQQPLERKSSEDASAS